MNLNTNKSYDYKLSENNTYKSVLERVKQFNTVRCASAMQRSKIKKGLKDFVKSSMLKFQK